MLTMLIYIIEATKLDSIDVQIIAIGAVFFGTSVLVYSTYKIFTDTSYVTDIKEDWKR